MVRHTILSATGAKVQAIATLGAQEKQRKSETHLDRDPVIFFTRINVIGALVALLRIFLPIGKNCP